MKEMTSEERKHVPLATGCFDYFPDALVEVARVSFAGNEKHNPGEPLHWSRGKSSDHPDAMLRHFTDRGGIDTIEANGKTYRLRHTAEAAWRLLAILQEELEEAGEAPLARGARVSPPVENTVSLPTSCEWCHRPFDAVDARFLDAKGRTVHRECYYKNAGKE